MEFLIVGIDGGDREIMESFEMPFLKNLFANEAHWDIRDTLFSRGWSQMLTGLAAPDLNSMYVRPRFDGTYEFTDKFDNSFMTSKDYVKTMPRLVNGSKRRFGMMNVPTTFPAEPVEGFIVSGGGGGMDPNQIIPVGACQPEHVSEYLKASNYKFDLRFRASGIRSFNELLDGLDSMAAKRTEAFIELTKREAVDVGFLCYRATTVVQYLAMSDVQACMAIKSMPEITGKTSDSTASINTLQVRIGKHFERFDQSLEKLFSELKPERFIVTSDHGAAPWLYVGNLDAYLIEKGYQTEPTSTMKIKSKLVGFARNVLPATMKRAVRSSSLAKKFKTHSFDSRKSLAFGPKSVRGIYINDKNRFGGPVEVGAGMDELVNSIVSDFNEDVRVKEIGLSARPYRRDFCDARFYESLPDIYIDGPGTILFDGSGEFIERNQYYGPLSEDLSDVHRDMYTGQKSGNALCCLSKELMPVLEGENIHDLRVIYKTLERYLQGRRA